MAVDGRIPLATRVPDISSTVGNGLLAGSRLAGQQQEQPLRNALLEGQVVGVTQQNEAGQFAMDGAKARAVLEHTARLRTLPEGDPRRDQYNNAFMERLGIPDDGEPDDMSDAGLDAIDAEFAPLVGAAGGRGKPVGKPRLVENDAGEMVYEQTYDDGNGNFTTQQAPVGGTIASERGEIPEDEAARKVKTAREIARAKLEEQGLQAPGIAEHTAASTEVGRSTEGRRTNRIQIGTDSAKAIPTLRRAIDLLGRVKTGGPQSISMAVRQRLGAETADEGELASKLGKAVLSQLKSTFGAAFTEKEGSRLERIEAGFGKSNATNLRLLGELLQVSERYANQAMEDAAEIKDYSTARAIQREMDFQFDEDVDMFGNLEQPGSQAIPILKPGDTVGRSKLNKGDYYQYIDPDTGKLKTAIVGGN